MVLTDDEQLNKNALMFIYMRENKGIQDKLKNIENVIADGASVNAVDKNYGGNTPLHIAAQRSEKDIVQLLLNNGAILVNNNDGLTPLQIAEGIESTAGKEISVLMRKHAATPDEISTKQNIPLVPSKNRQNSKKENKKKEEYLKRPGTSGVGGQFYETKLLSLILLRALKDADIEHFLLATNIRDIGDFDDVCFRYKLKNRDRNVMIFLQAKHRDDPDKGKLCVAAVKSSTGDFGYGKYFDSFLKIRQKFSQSNSDSMFKGDFNDVDCYFVLYTPLKENFEENRKCVTYPMCKKTNEFINTGDIQKPFQYAYDHHDVDFLTQFILEERVKNMGLVFLDFILSSKERHDTMMTNSLIKTFHPALARDVLTVSEIKPENYRIGHFRQDFFDSDALILITLKETLCKAIVINYCKITTLSKEEIQNRIKEILNRPCSQTISSLIGDVIIFDEKHARLILNEKYIPQNLLSKQDMSQIRTDLLKIVVTPAIVNDAIVLAGRPKLESLNFKLPVTFGNSDLSIRGNEKKISSRLHFLASKIFALLDKFKETKVIDISDETVGTEKILDPNTLETNGGIGGAVGNLLYFDKSSDMLAFNTVEHTLPDKAKSLLSAVQHLTSEDLAAYKVKVNIEVFPKVSFHASQHDKSLANEFLDRLWLYTGQAKEDGVESILKNDINYHCNVDRDQNQFLFNVHSDAIFLRFHDKIQHWWKESTKAPYLTKNDTRFDEAMKDIIDSPVLTVLNVMSIRQMKKIGLEFNPDSIKALDLDNFTQGIVNIVSDAVMLSTAKIMQSIKDRNDYIFVNLDYILQLPVNDNKTMIDELKHTKINTLVITNELPIEQPVLLEKLNNIITIFNGKKIILISEKEVNVEPKKQTNVDVLKDEHVNLINMTLPSQSKCLKELTVTYQGKEVTLNTVIDETSVHLVPAHILHTLINNGKVDIGLALTNPKYDQIKDYYINRPLTYDHEERQVNTLNDINDNVVIIAGKPCIGKTTLLTHLSLETKKIYPHLWIVRINLSYNRDFDKWQDKTINTSDMIKFLCKSALKSTDNMDEIEVDNGTVSVSNKNGEKIPFELNLFIHYYNNNRIIFLFDGFDRIYSHNAKECLDLFKILHQSEKRIWITTSSPFSERLEEEFGPPYKLELLSRPQQQSFLHSFWKTNLKLEKLNHDQFNNIKVFMSFLFNTLHIKHEFREEDRPIVTLWSLPLHLIYVTAVEYFKNEINLSPKFMREKLTEKWRLDSLTNFDKFLRQRDEENNMEPLELADTPLHMYIAANYFNIQIKDKLHFNVQGNELIKKVNVYADAITSYEQVLKANLKELCNIEKISSLSRKQVEKEQTELREKFIDKHKMLALYAICKESDVNKFLTKEEINEVKTTIYRIQSGEEELGLIDCIIDGVPRYYNLLFAEYFLVEFTANLMKGCATKDESMIKPESLWDFFVNIILMTCPPALRNAFDYKLKYDPELAKVADNRKCNKMIFDLIIKDHMKGNPDEYNADDILNTTINEGLQNLSMFLLKCVKNNNIPSEKIDVANRFVKAGLLTLSVVQPSWKEAADKALDSLKDVRQVAESLDSKQIEAISSAAVTIFSNTDVGQELNEKIKTHVAKPIKQATDYLVNLNASTSNNQNFNTLVEELPYHLPGIINTLFGKKLE